MMAPFEKGGGCVGGGRKRAWNTGGAATHHSEALVGRRASQGPRSAASRRNSKCRAQAKEKTDAS